MNILFRKLSYSALISISIANTAYSNDLSLVGLDLYTKCTSSNANDILNCKAYLIGSLDGRVAYMSESAYLGRSDAPLGICIYQYYNKPQILEDLKEAVIKQIVGNHERYDKTVASIAVVEAVKVAFPCKN